MMLPSIQLFSAYYQAFPLLPKVGYITPVQAGAAIAPHKLIMHGDDTGDNISHQNPVYSELTVAYWIMKNADRTRSDAWGLCHYRRYFIEDKYKLFYKKRSRYYYRTSQRILDGILTPALYNTMQRLLLHNDVIVQRPTWAMKEKGIVYNIKDAYTKAHVKEDYDATMNVVIEKFPGFAKSIDSYGQLKVMSYNNMMIARWRVWDDYLHFLFTVLDEVQHRINMHKEGYQSRVFGFLAERLHNLFIYHHQLKAGHLTLGLFEDKS
ncbi:MAG: DUF4422 domain-containing protein [Ferruginibacter sp.]